MAHSMFLRNQGFGSEHKVTLPATVAPPSTADADDATTYRQDTATGHEDVCDAKERQQTAKLETCEHLQWDMLELCQWLHIVPTVGADRDVWLAQLNSLHGRLHEKVEMDAHCPVCSKESQNRLWKDARCHGSEWNAAARAALWKATQETVRRCGTGWSAWRPVSRKPAKTLLPPRLLQESVPYEKIQALPEGGFGWGRYKTSSDITDKQTAWEQLDRVWQEDRKRRVDLLHELHQRPAHNEQNRPGEKHTLTHVSSLKTYQGRIWEAGAEWRFEEEGTGIAVAVAMADSKPTTREYFARRDLLLLRSMNAEYAKARAKARKLTRAAASKTDVPKVVGDMAIRGTSKEGKLIYSWGDSERGRLEVQVTPRKMRLDVEPGASSFKVKAFRETTPERALRKMTTKVRRIKGNAAKGQHERIVASLLHPKSFPTFCVLMFLPFC